MMRRFMLLLLTLMLVLAGCSQTKQPVEAGASEQAGDDAGGRLGCVLSISCANLVGNTVLAEEKRPLVPEDGWLLAPVECSFEAGESVFDLLYRETRARKIHMEYVQTPAYGSAYIEGIGNLYEFDGGPQSGWMFSVNGEFPNYGCSKVVLEDGDRVEWVYTCDLGLDVGGKAMG